MDCAQAKTLVSNFSLIQACDEIASGALRMSVPFTNTDGSNLDLFLKQAGPGKWVLSDLGNTTAYLLDLHVRPWTTKKRLQIVTDICRSLGIEQAGGQFQTILTDEELRTKLPEAMVRLSQACIRVSDLAFTQRLRTQAIFRDEVEDFFSTEDLQFEEHVQLVGQFGNRVEVDFRVSGKTVVSLVQTLSTGNAAAAHNLSNEVFRRWFDLEKDYKSRHLFLTIYDTSNDNFRDEDLKRIELKSIIFGFPAEPEQIKLALAA